MAGPVLVSPDDLYNRSLVANVHPPDWVNPQPARRYNLVVIGGGTAGLVAAAGAAGLGARVALVEKHLLGGDCLNVGCVPSKALLRAARAVVDVRDAEQHGVRVPAEVSVNFPAIMERMRRIRARLSSNDSAARFRDLGVDVFLGTARFLGSNSVDVGGQTLRFRRAVIATGARASRPDVPGLTEAGYFTNETVFFLMHFPARLAVVGAGPLGCELAQAFARFGAEVCLIGRQPQVMPRDDPDAAQIVQAALERDRVRMFLNAELTRVETAGKEKILQVRGAGGMTTLTVDEIVVGVGRTPNVEGLDLDAAGVVYDRVIGVHVNDRLQTSNAAIYAAGDICSRYKFTHAADAMARLVIQNALFSRRKKASALLIPWCTYTDPEVAHVGLSEQEAAEQYIPLQTFQQSLHDVDRAVLDGESEGFLRVHVRKGTDQIVGATLVARHAGEMISEITLAMRTRIGLKSLSGLIHPYPTQAEALKKVADAYNRTRLTPSVRWFLRTWMRLRR
jgi:pyruvate/2-oxoglutarate dehydrogenase complex dihydrolipoamide dehydrogenase (E3) component